MEKLEALIAPARKSIFDLDKPRPVYIWEGIYWTPTPRTMRWLNRTAALRRRRTKEARDGTE